MFQLQHIFQHIFSVVRKNKEKLLFLSVPFTHYQNKGQWVLGRISIANSSYTATTTELHSVKLVQFFVLEIRGGKQIN